MIQFTFYLLLTSIPLFATTFEVRFIGGCSSQPLLIQKIKFNDGLNVGDLSLKALDDNQIPYQGTSQGINQIFNSPIGLEALEILNEQEMLSYGWCYEIDNVIPEVYPNEILITKSTQVITWFYGYAHYLNGKWISQCEKSYLRQSAQICADDINSLAN